MDLEKILEIDNDRCVYCRKCERVCFSGALTIENHHGHIDPQLCSNCKMCISVCHKHAIRYI